MKYIFILSPLVFSLLANYALAQTGPFEFTIQYAGTQRTVSAWIPPDYDANNSYSLLVGLHGFSMNAASLREELIPLAENEDMLLFCLDGNGNRHDDELGGDEINFTMALLDSIENNWNVDSCEKYLFGFSYGGRETMYYGLTHADRFTGLIGFAPAIQSQDDADNMLAIPWASPFAYQHASSIPIVILYGSAENEMWKSNIQYFISKLNSNNAIDTLIIPPGVGHSIWYNNFTNDMTTSLKFLRRNLQVCQAPPTAVATITKEENLYWVHGGAYHFNPQRVKQVDWYDLQGRKLSSNRANSEVSMEHFKRGCYLMLITTNTSEVITVKVIR